MFTYLEIGWAMIEKLQHVPDVLRVLYHEIQLHVEFTAYELHMKKENKNKTKMYNIHHGYNSYNVSYATMLTSKVYSN